MTHPATYLPFLWLGLCAGAAQAQDAASAGREPLPPEERGIATFVLENDLFANIDRHYTNGVRFSYLTPEAGTEHPLPSVFRWLPIVEGASAVRTEYAFGQSMFTPQDITMRDPDPAERPYAGFLYGSAAVIAEHQKRQESLQLTLGVVGPYALGEEAQKLIHSAIDSPRPEGWRKQLHNEPIVNLSYLYRERGWRQASLGPLRSDLTPHWGGALGNAYTYANAGATIRLGQRLPDDLGPPRVEPSFPGSGYFQPEDRFGWYLFAGVDGRAVARNIFLDGNTFADSRSVNKLPLVGDVHLGAVATYGAYRLSYSYVIRSKEFHGQEAVDEYGIVALSAQF